jgi:uncharacterized cupredoxin-like copper-binding protein
MRLTPMLAVLALGLATVACGSDDSASGTNPTDDATRTIEIEMQDNKYVPETIDVADGETVRLVFTNNGTATHDAYVGDEGAQDDHEAEMNGDDGGHHMGDDDALTVEPGDTAELTHTFEASDEVLIGCHEPGHYDSGMRLTVDVT